MASVSTTQGQPAPGLSPSDPDLASSISQLRDAHPALGIAKLLAQLKLDHPDWTVSEKRFRKALQGVAGGGENASTGLGVVNGGGAGQGSGGKKEKALVAETGLDASVDVASIAPKVKVKMFSGGKGKGLVVKDQKIEQGEVIWQEEPWIVSGDPEHHTILTSHLMCSQCFSLFPRPNPPMSVYCVHCSEACFCNRLCYAKARSSSAAHHDLLCPGLNPDAASLRSFVRQKGARSVDAVAKIVARWRAEREWGSREKAEGIEKRVWKGMARISQQKKEAERKEWSYIGEARMEESKLVHIILCNTLNPQPSDDNYKPFQKLLQSHHPRKAKPVPLTDAENERWFSFESFLQLLGLVGLNQEDSGGLYALHAHMNHSCDPNVQVRNLPKTFTPPTTLPTELPPPMQPSDRCSNKLTILAKRTLHPGDELLISYVNIKMPRKERREALRENYGFWCACPRCVKEGKEEDGKAEGKVEGRVEGKVEEKLEEKVEEKVEGETTSRE